MGLRDNRRKDSKAIMRHCDIKGELLPCPKCNGEVLLHECVTSERKFIKCYDCGNILTTYDPAFNAFDKLILEFYEAK